MTRYILLVFTMICFSNSYSQNSEVTYENKGELIQANYYDDQGNLEQQGTFNRDGELHGTWVSYDVSGKKLVEAKYQNGKKVGKWLYFNNDIIKEVFYEDSKIVSVNEISADSRLVIRN